MWKKKDKKSNFYWPEIRLPSVSKSFNSVFAISENFCMDKLDIHLAGGKAIYICLPNFRHVGHIGFSEA